MLDTTTSFSVEANLQGVVVDNTPRVADFGGLSTLKHKLNRPDLAASRLADAIRCLALFSRFSHSAGLC